MYRRALAAASAIALSFSLAVTLAACGNDQLLGPNRGRVRLTLSGDGGSAVGDVANTLAVAGDIAGDRGRNGNSDKDDDKNDERRGDERPSFWFNVANVTVSSLLARNLEGQLVNVDLDLPVTVDIVRIDEGKQVVFPDGILPFGVYDQVVLVMTALQGTTRDGTTITIEPPGGGWTAIVPICELEVAEGGTSTVGISLMLRNAFRWDGGRFHFQPRFRADRDCPDDDDDEDDDEG